MQRRFPFRLRLRPLLLAVTMLLCGCARAPQHFPQEAYIWQRQWTPAVSRAMQASDTLVNGWRVLAAELSVRGQWHAATPDWDMLAAARQPVMLVVRIDGQLSSELSERQDDAIRHIVATAGQWRQRGGRIAGVEIDHDCATARLPAYARFLTALRQQLGGTKLSITALPAWLDSVELAALLAIPDESVLQVHAVLNPIQGLFDAARARDWIGAYGKQTRRPWRVALPAYGTRVSWDENGRISAVESERSTLTAGATARELVASPQQMRAFTTQLEKDRPPGLAGIVWFRLPTEADQRAWSPATWQTVLTHAPLQAGLSVRAQANGHDAQNAPAGLQDIVLHNAGNADAALPLIIRLDSVCRAADGINGYLLETDAQGKYLRRTREGLLRAGYQRNIGWVRCNQNNIQLHVER